MERVGGDLEEAEVVFLGQEALHHHAVWVAGGASGEEV